MEELFKIALDFFGGIFLAYLIAYMIWGDWR